MFHKSKLFLESVFTTAAENIKDFSVFSWALNLKKKNSGIFKEFSWAREPYRIQKNSLKLKGPKNVS
jgi:hypothetical protein